MMATYYYQADRTRIRTDYQQRRLGSNMQQEEKVFFEERGVKVTNSRFILPDQKTFAMSGVTAVRTSRTGPDRKWPTVCLVVGAAIAYAHGGINAASIVLLAAGALWMWMQKPTFFVVLSTSSGEQQALKDQSGSWISKIVSALNESIIFRG
jgi:Family of unknown function (DUF6232)